MMHVNRRYHSLTEYKVLPLINLPLNASGKQCQISINYIYFVHFSHLFVVKFKFFRESSDFLLMGVNIILLLRFKESNKFYHVQAAKWNFPHGDQFLFIF